MELTGRQKAALLLMSLDEMAAAELLKGLDTEGIQTITMELAQIDASKQSNAKDQEAVTQEFYKSLGKKQTQAFSMNHFLNEMLVKVVSAEEAKQIQSQIKKTTVNKELFAEIRSASTDELVLSLEGAHPQAIALVLSELSATKNQEVLSLLDEETRLKTICKMASPDDLGSGVKKRIALTISKKLKSLKGATLGGTPEKRKENLRKIAIVLSGMEKEMRDQLLDEISSNDEETGSMVKILMVTWEDITAIADRALQESLRNVDSSKLAMALYKADETIVEKIRKNISERAASMLDEEITMMQEPLEQEVIDAREEVVSPLRQANEEGTLRMTGR